MRRTCIEVLLVGAVVLATVSCGTLDRQQDADFQQFLSWWAGDYDNLAQVQSQHAAASPGERNRPTLLFIRKVDLAAFGSEVFYGEWQDADEPGRITRQRIYAFQVNEADGKLRLNLHVWPPDPAFIARTGGAHLDPRKLEGVTPADMRGLKGCDVFFDRNGGEFAGAMKKGACAFPAPDVTPVYSWSQMKLTANRFSYLDGWFHQDSGKPYRRFTDAWYEFDKKQSPR
jgi:hypothetical protein